MKQIIDVIYEVEADNRKRQEKCGTPDCIYYDGVEFFWYDRDARAFIYNKENNKICWSKLGRTHGDIIQNRIDAGNKNDLHIDNVKSVSEIRFADYEDYSSLWMDNASAKFDKAKHEWEEKHPESKYIVLGRVWYNKNNLNQTLIGSWQELTNEEFAEINNNVITDYNKLFIHRKANKIKEYHALDNNGNVIDMTLNVPIKIKIKKRSVSATKNYNEIAKNHPDTGEFARKMKRELTEPFRKNRDEKNQKTYNHTKSKTEAEYRSIKYQESKMKTITDYILESTPDGIYFNKKGYVWRQDNAFGFLYNTKTDTTLFSLPGNTHSDMIEALSEPGNDLINVTFINTKNVEDFRKCSYEYWNDLRPTTRGKQKTDYILGRLWNLRKSAKISNSTILIAFWQELNSEDMHKTILSTINTFIKENTKKKIQDFDIYAVDNNGKLYKFKHNEINKIENRSENSKKQIGIARAIHLATQEEKKDFYAAFKKNRDEKNQKIYNHTKSKTEAEYRSIKYQESKMKSVLDYINEVKYEHPEVKMWIAVKDVKMDKSEISNDITKTVSYKIMADYSYEKATQKTAKRINPKTGKEETYERKTCHEYTELGRAATKVEAQKFLPKNNG